MRTQRGSEKCHISGFEDEAMGSQATEHRWPQEAEKGKEMKSPLDLQPKKNAALLTSSFELVSDF